jgi:hypothetical protein
LVWASHWTDLWEPSEVELSEKPLTPQDFYRI